ncbi:TIR domain-containing protein [Frankia sp. AiPs1]|uniref:toll/interleukin-1 receptor domain-containing protein n=1 Tax=Frankia sp. AiPa1 TaxID=573492 RepID=UPI00202B477F|nr:toll/interleukin-1 receptor domain-containing protein [Frankia sp. AiPa1]MCL9760236.1 toll/interleukin-1 receptor domain-containing protein [Frankia sp. AiPa1]
MGGMGGVVEASLFVSWAHDDRAAKEALLSRLAFGALSGVRLTRWEDSDLLLGADWNEEILTRLATCDYGLLLVSPKFLASDYVREVELPRLLEPGRGRVLPVLLKQVPLDGSFDLRGLAARQIFTGAGGRAFTQTAGPSRERFAVDLTREIHRRVLADAA